MTPTMDIEVSKAFERVMTKQGIKLKPGPAR